MTSIKTQKQQYLKNAASSLDTLLVDNLSSFDISCHGFCWWTYTEQYDYFKMRQRKNIEAAKPKKWVMFFQARLKIYSQPTYTAKLCNN